MTAVWYDSSCFAKSGSAHGAQQPLFGNGHAFRVCMGGFYTKAARDGNAKLSATAAMGAPWPFDKRAAGSLCLSVNAASARVQAVARWTNCALPGRHNSWFANQDAPATMFGNVDTLSSMKIF